MTLHTAPRHAGSRSSFVADIAMATRYFFRIAFSTSEHAAYADSVTLFGAR